VLPQRRCCCCPLCLAATTVHHATAHPCTATLAHRHPCTTHRPIVPPLVAPPPVCHTLLHCRPLQPLPIALAALLPTVHCATARYVNRALLRVVHCSCTAAWVASLRRGRAMRRCCVSCRWCNRHLPCCRRQHAVACRATACCCPPCRCHVTACCAIGLTATKPKVRKK